MGIEGLLAPLIAGAGTVSGGLAAQAISGGKGGEGGQQQSISDQIQPALDFYQKAIDSYNSSAQTGLNYYQGALNNAYAALTNTSNTAASYLQPISAAGNAAMEQYQRMLGLDVQSATRNAATNYQSLFGNAGNNADIIKQLNNAEAIRDPAERAAARAAIQSSITSQQQTLQSNNLVQAQAAYNALVKQGAPTAAPIGNTYSTSVAFSPTTGYHHTNSSNNEVGNYISSIDGGMGKFNAWVQANSSTIGAGPGDLSRAQQVYAQQLYNTQVQNYNQQLEDAQGNINKVQSDISNLDKFSQSYATNYTDEGKFGYTGDQIADQLASTPGYQWQLGQGTQAISRTQAAKGMANSANTQLAINDYAQGLASNTYNSYMSNLMQQAGLGSQATTNMANIATNLGTQWAGLAQSQGNAYLSTYLAMGQNSSNQYGNMAQAWLGKDSQNSSQSNQQQLQASQNQNQLSAIALSQGMKNAQNWSANQQFGQGWLAGGGTGGSSGSGWPTYNSGTGWSGF